MAEGRLTLRHRKAREAHLLEVEAHLALLGELVAGRQRVGVGTEHRSHLGAALQEVLRVRLQQVPRLIQCHPVADRHQDVVKGPPLGQVVVDVVGGDRPGSAPSRQLGLPRRQPAVLRPEVVLELDQDVLAAEDVLEGLQPRLVDGPAASQAEEVRPVLGDPFEGGPRLPLGLITVGVAQEPGQVRPASHRFGDQDQVAAVDLQFGPDDGPDADPPAVVDELDDAVDTAVVADPERRHAELGGALDQLLRVAGAIQEGVVRVAVQLDVGCCRPHQIPGTDYRTFVR